MLLVFLCGHKSHYMRDCPNSTGPSPAPSQTLTMSTYSPPTVISQMETACFTVTQSSLVTILKELMKIKQANNQVKKRNSANSTTCS